MSRHALRGAMPFCPSCSQATQGWERHCPRCGFALAASPPAAPSPAAPPPRRDTGLAEALLVAGGVVSVAVPALVGLALLFLGGVFSLFPPFGSIPAAFLGFLAVLFLVLGVVWAAAALHARNLVHEGHVERGGLVALVAGALGVLTGNVLGGVLLLAGGFLAYSAK